MSGRDEPVEPALSHGQAAGSGAGRRSGTRTIVALHAHPDDEALLTGGTLARLAAHGHRVVLVVATDGAAGLAEDRFAADGGLAARRAREAQDSAAALGCARVVLLGYPDSGSRGPMAAGAFAGLDPDEPAARVAALLDEEDADLLLGYDPAGGYGHRDHVQVHRVARLAATMARRPPRLLEATVDRDLLARAIRVLGLVARLLPPMDLPDLSLSYTPHASLTHRVDVRAHLPAKRAALRAHRTQSEASGRLRTVALLSAMRGPLGRWVLGREWFVEVGPEPDGVLRDDPLTPVD